MTSSYIGKDCIRRTKSSSHVFSLSRSLGRIGTRRTYYYSYLLLVPDVVDHTRVLSRLYRYHNRYYCKYVALTQTLEQTGGELFFVSSKKVEHSSGLSSNLLFEQGGSTVV